LPGQSRIYTLFSFTEPAEALRRHIGGNEGDEGRLAIRRSLLVTAMPLRLLRLVISSFLHPEKDLPPFSECAERNQEAVVRRDCRPTAFRAGKCRLERRMLLAEHFPSQTTPGVGRAWS
jgi:hypothetical protein